MRLHHLYLPGYACDYGPTRHSFHRQTELFGDEILKLYFLKLDLHLILQQI